MEWQGGGKGFGWSGDGGRGVGDSKKQRKYWVVWIKKSGVCSGVRVTLHVSHVVLNESCPPLFAAGNWVLQDYNGVAEGSFQSRHYHMALPAGLLTGLDITTEFSPKGCRQDSI